MIKKSLGDMAYTVIDVDGTVSAAPNDALRQIDGVLAVRYRSLSK